MKTLGYLAAVLAAASLTACGGGSSSPTSPSSRNEMPNVAGTYTGNLAWTVSGAFFMNVATRMEVRQSQTTVSIQGYVEGNPMAPLSCTIDSLGTITTCQSNGSGGTQDATCGTITGVRSSGSFNANSNTFVYDEVDNTDWCGQWHFSGTLHR